MTATVPHLDHLCPLDAPECRRPPTASHPLLHAAEPGTPGTRSAPSTPGAPSEPPRPLGAIDLSPVSAYEIVTRQMIEATQRDVAEIKGRINNLMVMACGAVLFNIILRMAGLG